MFANCMQLLWQTPMPFLWHAIQLTLSCLEVTLYHKVQCTASMFRGEVVQQKEYIETKKLRVFNHRRWWDHKSQLGTVCLVCSV